MSRKPPRSTEERLVRWQRSMAPGTLAGRIASAAPMALDVTRLDPRLRGTTPQPKPTTYTLIGPVSASRTGAVPLPNDSGGPLNISSVRPGLGTAAADQAVIIDVLVDGTSIFDGTTQPQVDPGDTLGAAVAPITNRWAAGGVLTIDVLQGDAAATDLRVTLMVT